MNVVSWRFLHSFANVAWVLFYGWSRDNLAEVELVVFIEWNGNPWSSHAGLPLFVGWDLFARNATILFRARH